MIETKPNSPLVNLLHTQEVTGSSPVAPTIFQSVTDDHEDRKREKRTNRGEFWTVSGQRSPRDYAGVTSVLNS